MVNPHDVKPMQLEDIVKSLNRIQELLPNESAVVHKYADFLSHHLLGITDRYERPTGGYAFSPCGLEIAICESIANCLKSLSVVPDDKLLLMQHLREEVVKIVDAIAPSDFAELYRQIRDDTNRRFVESGFYDPKKYSRTKIEPTQVM